MIRTFSRTNRCRWSAAARFPRSPKARVASGFGIRTKASKTTSRPARQKAMPLHGVRARAKVRNSVHAGVVRLHRRKAASKAPRTTTGVPRARDWRISCRLRSPFCARRRRAAPAGRMRSSSTVTASRLGSTTAKSACSPARASIGAKNFRTSPPPSPSFLRARR